jgi:hypothetical protein
MDCFEESGTARLGYLTPVAGDYGIGERHGVIPCHRFPVNPDQNHAVAKKIDGRENGQEQLTFYNVRKVIWKIYLRFNILSTRTNHAVPKKSMGGKTDRNN